MRQTCFTCEHVAQMFGGMSSSFLKNESRSPSAELSSGAMWCGLIGSSSNMNRVRFVELVETSSLSTFSLSYGEVSFWGVLGDDFCDVDGLLSDDFLGVEGDLRDDFWGVQGVFGDDFCCLSRTVLAPGDVSSSWSDVVLGDDFELLPLRIRISSGANLLLMFEFRRVGIFEFFLPSDEFKLLERAELGGVSSHDIVSKIFAVSSFVTSPHVGHVVDFNTPSQVVQNDVRSLVETTLLTSSSWVEDSLCWKFLFKFKWI